MGVSTFTRKFTETYNITTTHHAITGTELVTARPDQKPGLAWYKAHARSTIGSMETITLTHL